MKSYQNILVGINYTDASRHALRMANQIAIRSGASLTACHVVPMAELNEFVTFYLIEQEMMMTAARSSLADFVEEVLGDEHQVSCKIAEGIPHHEIASLAIEGKFDLLVLGDDDYADDSRKAGQFAIKCLRFATMPVLLVNRPPAPSDTLIAACIDFSKSTTPILEHAARIATPNHHLHLIHTNRPPWLRPERLRYQTTVFEDQGQKEQFREILEGQLTAISRTAESTFPGQVDAACIEHQDPTEALLEHLASSSCGLIVLGRSGKGLKGIVSSLLGGTAEAIIRQATCPILIIPINN
ncbi:MAG: universal stress protein [Verrucomicrobiaceae bacterium]